MKGSENMKNLEAEMKRYGVSVTDIQTAIDCRSEKTAWNKVRGRTAFTVFEALKVKNRFFPGFSIEYLFAADPQPDKEKTA